MEDIKKLYKRHITKEVLLVLIIVLSILIIYGAYQYHLLWRKNSFNQVNSILLEQELNRTTNNLNKSLSKNTDLEGELDFQEKRVTNLSDQFNEVANTVGVLDKLSKTDPELLQKYSKVFFLNEHYAPQRLTDISEENLYSETETHKIHIDVLPHLEDLLNAAKDDGMKIYIKSAYRSFNNQASIKSAYSTIYGSGANTFSADQGYSEHQLGTTVDFITVGLGGKLDGFENTEEYNWLQDNAYKYGFTLSYPKNNAYYIFEPWHWRFVGINLAKKLKDDGIGFYDADQRAIDKYLVDIFE